MQFEVRVGDGSYSGPFDLIAMAETMGVTPEVTGPTECKVFVTATPVSENEVVAAAKMVNYGHSTLTEQGAVCNVSYDTIRHSLLHPGSELPASYEIEFVDSDSALFFLAAMRNIDLNPRPKWQIWLLPDAERDDVPPGVKFQVFDGDHFKEHYFHKVTKVQLPALTASTPDSAACKLLEAVRNRVGRKIGVISVHRTRMTPEQKHANAVIRIADEDKRLAPEAFALFEKREIEFVDFQSKVREAKRVRSAAARSSKRLTTGSKASVVRKISSTIQQRIDKAQDIVARKRSEAS